MKQKAVIIFCVCCLVTPGIANVFGENPRKAALDQLRELRKYAYATGGKNRRDALDDDQENWTGRWMPDRPDSPTPPPKVFASSDKADDTLKPLQSVHGVAMGYPSAACDDAKTNLTVDWDGNPLDYVCYEKRIVPDRSTIAVKYCERIPKYYVATHKCMYEEIVYDDDVPLFGPHRPLWPVYGEYRFLPKQRWLHSLEHGAIVALYHPCANPMEVKRLKSLLAGCLRRHIISPYNLLDERRPLALVSWGCRLSMSYVDAKVVTGFILEHALQGPEDIARDGDFTDGLIHRAEIVSDSVDTIVCPHEHTV
ncbi:uncharacterized protein LOC143427570 [Xylocopa sonorina]|uniref:uncharacterized protein LOC143427570 n=1 Tax=Xylocopa sonorina TaxID=1818115 RepID=UPI00403AB99B